MNRPTYSAIGRYSATKPVLVFVSSRRQTRLTAIDLVRLAAADGRPGRFVRNPSSSNSKLQGLMAAISDNSLRECLSHGIGIHHAGLNRVDRSIVEELFANGYAQVLVSTSTLAWGVNLPAHLVVVKGTEYFDAKQGRYVDMPVTDILQMMGRAGRPQFDTQAYAVILVHEPKKTFLKKFLYEPFPVESSLHLQLSDHLSAEIAAGTIRSPQDAMDYLTWTYLFRRVFMNPGFYNVASDDNSGKRVQPTSGMISSYFSDLIQACFKRLSVAGCITVGLRLSNQSTLSLQASSEVSPRLLNMEAVSNVPGIVRSCASGHTSCDSVQVHSTALGQVAANYYLSHKSIHRIGKGISPGLRHADVIRILAECDEFSKLPVRPNEEQVNTDYAIMVAESMVASGMFTNRRACMQALGLSTNPELPSSKARLLLHGYLAQVRPPILDYIADLRSVLDQSDRVLQAIVDVAAERGIFSSVKACVELSQMLYQGRLMSLGPFNSLAMDLDIGLDKILANAGFRRIFDLLSCKKDVLRILTDAGVSGDVARSVYKMLERVPCLEVAGRITDNQRNISVSITNKTAEISRSQTETRSTVNPRTACAATNAKNGRMRDESWIVLVSEHGTDCLMAVKRLGRVQGNGGTRTVNLLLNDKSSSLRRAYDVTVMSDVYIGIDQVTKVEAERELDNIDSKAL
jgi:activating signal cointegrator complex subunit 3